MPEFLAATSREALSSAALRTGELAEAGAHAGGPAAPARFLGAIAGPAAEAVRAAMTAAGLRPERITPAVTLRRPCPARPGGGAAPAGPPSPARSH